MPCDTSNKGEFGEGTPKEEQLVGLRHVAEAINQIPYILIDKHYNLFLPRVITKMILTIIRKICWSI